ncbi:MAG: peptidoglycan-associated lipoprotein Pal [Nitrospirae bacterium]|nr:peptidoglycan-associated lipoprotein Pal [Nitrospirota bacterium]NTW65285.1 peptidoglycan-associated lipoprotein Pal [Nitrospirota bacterium]
MKSMKHSVIALMIVLGSFMLYGCPKSAEVSSAPETQPQKAEQAPAKPAEETAAAATAEAARKAAEEKAAIEAAAASAAGLQPIYFDFDRAFIRDDARSVMKANADYLKANPKVKVRIEGNCDERGTIEYNQALGQRRAANAKKYLTDMGISGNRITLISYGKEKPVCTEGTEDCWQKNRRDDLIANNE